MRNSKDAIRDLLEANKSICARRGATDREILEALAEHAQTVRTMLTVRMGDRRDICVYASGVVYNVLRWLGIQSRPMTVRASLYNFVAVQMVEWANAGGTETGFEDYLERNGITTPPHTIGLGFGPEGQRGGQSGPGRWNGHLVVIAQPEDGPDWLIDLTVDQASRPDSEMTVKPLAGPLAQPLEDFLENGGQFVDPDQGWLIQYDPDPEDWEWLGFPDFNGARADWTMTRKITEILFHAIALDA